MATANFTDMSVLATDPTFTNRVLISLVQYCTVTIPSETIAATAVQLHVSRKQYASAILNNPTLYKPLFVNAVAANQIVANEATVSGTIALANGATLATAAALCLDADISNAIAAAFNAFISGI
jgi:hypothetical protein